MENKTTGFNPEWDYEARLYEAQLKELTAKNQELTDQLENLRACYRETAENYERVNVVAQDQAEKIRSLKKELEDSELARDRLEGQMEVVRMFLSNNRNS